MFIEQGSKGNNQVFLYLLTILISITGFVSVSVFLMEQVKLDESDRNQMLFLNLLPFSIIVISIIVNTVSLHKRKISSLFNATSDFRIRRYFFSFFWWLILMASGDIAYYCFVPDSYIFNFQGDNFIKLVLISLSLFPIQTLAEELLFRSYILQGVYQVFGRAILPAIISSLLFMGLHMANPETAQFGYSLMIPYYFMSGLFLGILTILDDGIEQGYGIHTATNIYGAILVGYEGSALQTNSLWTIKNPSGLVMVASTLLMMFIYFILSRRKFKMHSMEYLFKVKK